MSLGDIYTTSTPDSSAKKNLFGIVSGTGAYLASLDKSKITAAFCTSTGSGLTADHFYVVSSDNTTFIDVSVQAPHTHDDATTGGELIDIFEANGSFTVLQLLKTQDLQKAQWNQTVTGTGSIEDFTDGTTGERAIRLRPNGTSGSGATISYPFLQAHFGSNMVYEAKLLIEDITSVALHSGVNCDDVTAADSNTRKLQAEVCTVTNSNWWLRTADGTANSASDSGIAIQNNIDGIRIEHHPDLGTPETLFYRESGSALQKTTNIPIDSQAARNNIIKHSVKNSTNADRPLKMYGCRISFKISANDDWVI